LILWVPALPQALVVQPRRFDVRDHDCQSGVVKVRKVLPPARPEVVDNDQLGHILAIEQAFH